MSVNSHEENEFSLLINEMYEWLYFNGDQVCVVPEYALISKEETEGNSKHCATMLFKYLNKWWTTSKWVELGDEINLLNLLTSKHISGLEMVK